MARPKSEFLSAFGTAFQVFKAITDKVIAVGGCDEDIRRVLSDQKLANSIAQLLVGTSRVVTNYLTATHRILVDRTKSLTEVITAGRYDYVNPNITTEHFPTIPGPAVEEDIVFFHFNRTISSDEAEKAMNQAGYKPADIFQLGCLGLAQPELQREFPIVALGSVWRYSDGDDCVAYLRGWFGERRLSLNVRDADWDGLYRFAAVRK